MGAVQSTWDNWFEASVCVQFVGGYFTFFRYSNLQLVVKHFSKERPHSPCSGRNLSEITDKVLLVSRPEKNLCNALSVRRDSSAICEQSAWCSVRECFLQVVSFHLLYGPEVISGICFCCCLFLTLDVGFQTLLRCWQWYNMWLLQGNSCSDLWCKYHLFCRFSELCFSCS